jgi:uncharacterized membrane protein YdjX (TVP38/TMEM64 family)
MNATTTQAQRRLTWLKSAGALVGLACVLLLLRAFDLPRLLLGFVEWVRQAGGAGTLSFGIVYAVAAVLLLPASILTLGAGFVWGPFLGLAVVLPSATVAATVAFLLGRTVARGWVQRRVADHPRFRAIDEAVGSGGFRLVLLLRLSPLFPFNLLNYTLGLTRVSLRDYVLGSAIGMAPGTFLYLYLGSLVTSASQLLSGERPSAGPLGTVLYAAGLAATLVVSVWVTRTARAALSKTLAEGKDVAP